MEKTLWIPRGIRGGWRGGILSPVADGGEVGGSSRRERYPVPGTAPIDLHSIQRDVK